MAKKINISIDDELLSRLDNYADTNYLTRSGLISIALNNYLTQKEAIASVKKLAIAFEQIASTGKLDEETMKQLSDFSKFANFFIQNS